MKSSISSENCKRTPPFWISDFDNDRSIRARSLSGIHFENQEARIYNSIHSAHDYAALSSRWLGLAKKTKLTVLPLASFENYSVFGLKTERPGNATYLSAGIHGDEPAGVWALLEWCEANFLKLKKSSWVIFPCLNPWGLMQNLRYTQSGADLNRSFDRSDPTILKWKQRIGRQRFKRAILLHEDFDATGIYAYQWGGESNKRLTIALKNAASIIPIESKTKIDGFKSTKGIIRLPVTPARIPGLPEARHLHNVHTNEVYLFESPSEFSFFERVMAHKAFLHNMLQ